MISRNIWITMEINRCQHMSTTLINLNALRKCVRSAHRTNLHIAQRFDYDHAHLTASGMPEPQEGWCICQSVLLLWKFRRSLFLSLGYVVPNDNEKAAIATLTSIEAWFMWVYTRFYWLNLQSSLPDPCRINFLGGSNHFVFYKANLVLSTVMSQIKTFLHHFQYQ